MCSPIGNEISVNLFLRDTVRISDAQLSALDGCGAKVSSYKFPLGTHRQLKCEYETPL